MALKQLGEMSLADVEALRLILRGDSVIDWHRLNFESEADIAAWLTVQEFQPGDPRDRARMNALRDEAVAYLRRNFELAIPKPVEHASVEELMMLASGKGHRQVCACSILKATHIMHHLDARELLFTLPISPQELFQLVEDKVFRVIGAMLAERFPIIEFIGGRKNKDSLYTKLLSKSETSAAQIYDKLRFRIVTRAVDDLLPVLLYLTERLFPFSYTVPGQSVNTIFHFRSYCQAHPHLARFVGGLQGTIDDEYTPSDNTFSAESYRVMHFVVDMPVRLPDAVLDRAPAEARALGPVAFVLCEFQLVDQKTEASNELGDASHAKYKERQRAAVMRRLKLGVREMREPPREPPPTSQRGRGR
ncbi:MAG: TIGR04552 family protein [Polyangiaceae bacterium]|nr:TIGR04552 family protein [Polyangiaceae bacterium]